MKPKILKAFKQGDSTVVVIPSSFTDFLEISPGDYLKMSVTDDKKLVIECME